MRIVVTSQRYVRLGTLVRGHSRRRAGTSSGVAWVPEDASEPATTGGAEATGAAIDRADAPFCVMHEAPR